MQKIYIFDSALRDGAQAKGISYSLEDKLHMLKVLDEAGVDYIEAGNPVHPLIRKSVRFSNRHPR